MATTIDSASLSLRAESYPFSLGHYDEVYASTGVPRSPCVEVMNALAQLDLSALRERVQIASARVALSLLAAA